MSVYFHFTGAPRSMGPGARNAVRKGRGNGFAPGAKPGPMAYGPGRWKPPAAGYLPQGVRSRCCAPTNLRAAPPPAQGQPARSTAARAGLEDLLGAGDDVVLGLAGKHVEEGGIACHPDDQIPVLFRMDLGVQ